MTNQPKAKWILRVHDVSALDVWLARVGSFILTIEPRIGRACIFDIPVSDITCRKLSVLFERTKPFFDRYYCLPCDQVTLMLAAEFELARRLCLTAITMDATPLTTPRSPYQRPAFESFHLKDGEIFECSSCSTVHVLQLDTVRVACRCGALLVVRDGRLVPLPILARD
jgi:hypothetical protein